MTAARGSRDRASTSDVELAVILAAPRSGSTYLQNLISLHPRITSPQETHLFHNYLAPLLAQWERDRSRMHHVVCQLEASAAPDHRLIGLPTLLEDKEFEAWLGEVVQLVLRRAVSAKPSADLVVEKTPSNSLVTEDIVRLLPSTRFVHIARNPSQVVASQLGARSWGGPWADVGVRAAAARWVAHVEPALALARTDARVRLVHYEDLVATPQSVLCEVCDFLERPISRSEAAAIVGRAAAGETSYALSDSLTRRLGTGPIGEPRGFARVPGERRRELSRSEQSVVHATTDRVARELGYAVTTSSDAGPRRYAHLAEHVVRDAIRRLTRRIR